jgi:hypothetical protein
VFKWGGSELKRVQRDERDPKWGSELKVRSRKKCRSRKKMMPIIGLSTV